MKWLKLSNDPEAWRANGNKAVYTVYVDGPPTRARWTAYQQSLGASPIQPVGEQEYYPSKVAAVEACEVENNPYPRQ